jgi:hypothetical protein
LSKTRPYPKCRDVFHPFKFKSFVQEGKPEIKIPKARDFSLFGGKPFCCHQMD